MKAPANMPASRIIITTTEDGQLDIALADVTSFPQFVQELFTGLLAMMTQTANRANADNREEAVQEIYDMVNNAASNVLSLFAPEIDMRPTITTEALLRAENEIMREVVEKFEAEEGPIHEPASFQSSVVRLVH